MFQTLKNSTKDHIALPFSYKTWTLCSGHVQSPLVRDSSVALQWGTPDHSIRHPYPLTTPALYTSIHVTS